MTTASVVSVFGQPTDSAAAAKRGPEKDTVTASSQRDLMGEQLLTRDGVMLTATYYPSNKDKGEEAIPVLLIHGARRDRNDFSPLLDEFRSRGYAVLAVDLRGHGTSTNRYQAQTPSAGANGPYYNGPYNGPPGPYPQQRPNNPPQKPQPPKPPKVVEYKVEDFIPQDFDAMVMFDAGPLKNFLVEEHRAKRLNISRLVLVGIDTGATLASIWGSRDWGGVGTPPGSRPMRDTKVIIMISPRDEDLLLNTLANKPANKPFHDNVDFLTMVGKINDAKFRSAEAIQKTYFGTKPETTDLGLESRFPVLGFRTERQGPDILAATELGAPKIIADFIETRMAKRKVADIRWGPR